MSSRSGATSIYRALVVWIGPIAVEFIHGFIRAVVLVPRVGDLQSRQIGVFTGSALILIVAYLCVRWISAPNTRALIALGVIWAVLTFTFELGFGHFVFGRSWAGLLSDYDVRHGGFLGFGMFVLAVSPLIATHIRTPPYNAGL